MTNFSDYLSERKVVDRGSFPAAYYDEDGDYLEILFEGASHVDVRLDDFMTAYETRTGEIVGVMLKDVVQKLKKKLPGLDLGKPVRLYDLLRAASWLVKSENPRRERAMETVLEKAGAHYDAMTTVCPSG
jgi:hypothetical protein